MRGAPDAHRDVQELLGAHALDQLDEPERTVLVAHLDGCGACREELRGLRSVAAALATVDASHLGVDPSPPPSLGTVVVARVAAERTDRDRRRAAERLRRRTFAAAAAVALLGGGVVAGYALAPQPAAVPLEPVAISTVSGVDADAALVPHTWGMEIRLTAAGFDAGVVYRVVVIDGSERVDAGSFVGTGAEEMVCNLNSSVLRDDADAFEVLDPDGRAVVTSRI